MPFAPPDGSAFRYHREKVVFTCPRATGGCGGRSWVDVRKNVLLSSMQSFCVSGRESYFPSSRRGQSPRHTRRHEQRTWLHPDGNHGNADTDDDPQRRRPVRLAALAAAATTVANRRPCGIFCSFCAMTPTPTTGTACFASAGRSGLVPERGGEGPDCASGTSFTLRPRWPGITLAGVTPGLGFYGLRSTARAGNLRLQSAAGSWSIVISHWGRIRLCRSDSAGGCQ